MEKISVIVPVYNSEKKLDKCLLSIVNQTYKNIEIIVINDGSKDNSLKIINKYKKLYPDKIKVYSWENHGIGMSRNKGICLATGDYIGFVDSDDYIELNMYEELINLVKINKADVGICNLRKYNDLDSIKDFGYSYSKNIFSLPKDHEMINIIEFGPCNKLFKKELFKDLSFPIKLKYEDFKLVAILFDRAKKIGKINETLCYFTKREKSETTTMDEKVFDLFISFDELLKYFKNKKYVKESLDSLIILKLTDYCLLQKYQKNLKLGYKFIDEAFDYIKNNTINYKSNKCFKKMNFLKRLISKSKNFTKIYCSVYHIFLNSL